MIVTILDRVNSLKHYATCFVLLNVTDSLQSEKTIGLSLKGILCKFYVISSKNRLLHMQITADSIGVYTKVFSLTGGNWQKWKRVFLTCHCHKIYRDEAVGLKSCKNTWKITIFVKMWNLGQYRENLIFCQ